MRTSAPRLLGAILLTACTATVGTPTPHGTVTITETCTYTACDHAQTESDSMCDRCWNAAEDACIYSSYCDPWSLCRSSCAVRSCSETQRSTCMATGFTVELPEEDPSLAKACIAAIANLQSCGVSVPDPDACHTYAKVQRPSRVAAYDCMAKLACDRDFATCDVAVSNLGDTWCEKLDTTCGAACEAGVRETLNTGGAWWSDDAIGAVNGCLSSCASAASCAEAFLAAVK